MHILLWSSDKHRVVWTWMPEFLITPTVVTAPFEKWQAGRQFGPEISCIGHTTGGGQID